jgi:membrane fusion protein (multidrug efflux system)
MNAIAQVQRRSLELAPNRRALVAVGAATALGSLFLAGYVPRYRARQSLAASTAAAGSQALRVEVSVPRPDTRPPSLTLPGSLDPMEATAIYARATGYVRRWRVDIGDQVAQGQVLAEIDTPDLDQQLQQAREALGQTKAALEQAQANDKYAAITAGRYQTLGERRLVAQQDVDQTKAQADVGRANVHAAESALAAQAATVHQLEQLKAFARVVAPFAGTITERHIDRGTLVMPGSASGTPLYAIAISNPLRLFVKVPQTFAAGIVIGSPVEVRVRQFPGRAFPGKVTRTAGALDPATRTLTVEAQVDNDKGELLAGDYADVTLKALPAHGVTVLPASALVLDAQGTRVVTVDRSSKAHFVPVQIGRDLGQDVEIVHGLTGQEDVVTAPPASLVEGMRLETTAAK